jgi:alpha-galactosidase
MEEARRWVAAKLEGNLEMKEASPLFSFTYDGKPSADLLKTWRCKRTSRPLDARRMEHTLTCADPKTGLVVRCVGVAYADFPVLEWTVYFKNTGQENTPLLENIQTIDVQVERGPESEFVLRHCNGDMLDAALYQPFEKTLTPKSNQRFTPGDGRPSSGSFPYYNLQMPGGGLILAVGWPGQWAASFTRDQKRGLHVLAGQELTHFVLQPGEEVRTPLIAVLFWQGTDVARSQNLWRRWMIAHNVPRTSDGKLPPPILPAYSGLQFYEMTNANTENQKQFIDRYVEERLGIDYWWMDAGWYWNKGNWWWTGTWEVDTKRFPGGLRTISDHAHAKGIRTIVWFEPERVTDDTWLSNHHPEWLLRQKDLDRLKPTDPKNNALLNLGDPKTLQWLVNHVDKTISEQGIDLYRQDYNIGPLLYWREHDSADRQGITEIKYVTGYLAYFDELRRRHPDMLLDSCASGGRRNDLETMRRAVALHPTDYGYENMTAKQAFHYSLFQWIPYFGATLMPVETVNAYNLRSGFALTTMLCYDVRRKDLDYSLLRKLVAEWRLASKCYYGDYYPLTHYSLDDAAWIAWQFDCPESDEGVVHAFRRGGNMEPSKTLQLAGLNPAASYDVADLGAGTSKKATGMELMERGLTVDIPEKPGAVVIKYRKL